MTYIREVFHGRRAISVSDNDLVLTVLEEGGHIAQLLHKQTGVSPLWIPHWKSLEPSKYSNANYPEYDDSNEAQLVAGLMGHNICLDLFGAPDPEEAAAGMPVHGEAPVALYQVDMVPSGLTMSTILPKAQLEFRRSLKLEAGGIVRISESVHNQSRTDRPIGWTQHVTLGAPFLEKGRTRFLVSSRRAKVYELDFNNGLGDQEPAAIFDWPLCPRKDGTFDDLSVFTSAESSGGFTAHQMNPEEDHAYFLAWSPGSKLVFGYGWQREDFPWLSRWEENHLRPWAPWNSNGLALGMEFGVSPMVESRRQMVERGRLFDTPTFRWIPAMTTVSVSYCAFLRSADDFPSGVKWDGESTVQIL